MKPFCLQPYEQCGRLAVAVTSKSRTLPHKLVAELIRIDERAIVHQGDGSIAKA
jgi:hypothetical protein